MCSMKASSDKKIIDFNSTLTPQSFIVFLEESTVYKRLHTVFQCKFFHLF